jgi:hypothetical protein
MSFSLLEPIFDDLAIYLNIPIQKLKDSLNKACAKLLLQQQQLYFSLYTIQNLKYIEENNINDNIINITQSSYLYLSRKVQADKIDTICKELYNIYKSDLITPDIIDNHLNKCNTKHRYVKHNKD